MIVSLLKYFLKCYGILYKIAAHWLSKILFTSSSRTTAWALCTVPMLVSLLIVHACASLCPAAKHIEAKGIVAPPRGLNALAGVLSLQPGFQELGPDERKGVHPLMVPLALAPKTGEVSGVLAVPGAVDVDPVRFVPVTTVGRALRPLGENCVSAAKRALIELDLSGAESADAAIAAAAADGIVYQRGEASVPLGKAGAAAGLAAYILPKVGPFADIYERLAKMHLDKGSEASALVTCERAQRAFSEWGSPYAFHAHVQKKFGRADEARDIARLALSKPLWSLGQFAAPETLVALTEMAKYGAPEPSREWYASVMHLEQGAEPYRMPNGASMGFQRPSLKESEFVMALPFLDPDVHSWDSICEELAACFESEGRKDLAQLVLS